MPFLLAVLFCSLFARPALAAKVVLFVNMNYSSQELKAAEDMAAARGQRLEVVPPREMVPLAEPAFRQRDAQEAELVAHFPGKKLEAIHAALEELFRLGPKATADPEISDYLGPSRVQALYASAQSIFQREAQLGSVHDQLDRKARELQARGDWVDSLIVSSHSDGSNLTGETTNRLSANELQELKAQHPQLLAYPRHVLLLGCYNMTRPNHEAWRYSLFPNAMLLAGFGIKAPSRFSALSPSFIRQVMSTAERLDQETARAGKALDPAHVSAAFTALSSFTNPAFPGVVDYCYQIVEGQANTWAWDCAKQWKDLRDRRERLKSYWSLTNPDREPPLSATGELRNFYNALQLSCPAAETPGEEDNWQRAEQMRSSFRENVIRLLFWWNVQQNFATYFAADIPSVDRLLATSGVENTLPTLNGTASRVEFVKAYNSMDLALQDQPYVRRRFESLYGPLYYLRGETSVAPGDSISVEETLHRGAIPFNWIEGSTAQRKP